MKTIFTICTVACVVLALPGLASASAWETMDAGLQDTTNYVDTGLGSGGGTLNSRSDIAGDPGTRFNIMLAGSGWQDIAIGDGFDLPTNNAGIAAATGNGGNLSAYAGYTMTIHNPGTDAFMVALYMNTGWTDPPWSHTDCYYQNDDGSVTWVGSGQTVTLTLDFGNAALWTGSGYSTGLLVQNLAYVTNIGLKIGGNLGNSGEVQSGVAFDVDIVAHANVLELNVQSASLYVKPGENVIVDMDVKRLLQMVNGCQAMLGYSSTYFPDPTGGVIQPGGGVWDLVIYDSWAIGSGVSGDIDTAIGVDAQGAVGTNADGRVAYVTLVAGSTEGITQMVFRADHPTDDTQQTFLSDMSATAVWPTKYNSQTIVIDGTAPTISITSAKQGGQELIGTATNAVQGVVNIQVTASDALAGLAGPPTVTVTPQGGSAESATYINESPFGTFNYTWSVSSTTPNGTATIDATVSDKAGNTANAAAQTFNVNKSQVTGTVSMSTLSGSSYSFNRNVVFKATDSGGSVLASWTVAVSFVNNTGTQVASGSYTLTDVPASTASLSAKTAWSLRERQAVTFDGDMQATNDFTLLGGDVDGGNSVNILDYSVLKVNWLTINAVADINGDGQVQTLDYSLMKSNWFKKGDLE